MSEDTKLQQLIINLLSPKQYEQITNPSSDELYAVEDNTVYASIEDLATKQDKIDDLATIRQGATKGATSIQPTDIASANKLGLIAGGNWLTVNQSTGKMECGELTKAQYNSALGYTFISKTTLNNVLVDYLKSSNIKTINGENIVGNGNVEIKSTAPTYIEETETLKIGGN